MKPLLRFACICALILLSRAGYSQTEITFYTTKGTFVVKMYDSITPITSGNFISLVKQKFYDGIIFHRVIKNFMIQGGDPNGNGTGGPGYSIQDEFDSSLSNVQKTISMANAGPNTGGSQFFINLVNNTYLDFNKPPYTSAHPVFGITITNFSVVQAIGNVPVASGSNKPLTDVVMDSLRVTYEKPSTGVADHDNNLGRINIYPNPVGASSMMYVNTTEAGEAQIVLQDAKGRVLRSTRQTLLRGTNEITMNEADLVPSDPGMYTVSVIAGGSRSVKKLLVVQ